MYDSEGERSRFEHAGSFQRVTILRPTKRHVPRIAVATNSTLLLLHAKKLTPYWQKQFRSSGESIRELRIADGDRDSRLDLAVDTVSGTTWFNVDGKVLRQSR